MTQCMTIVEDYFNFKGYKFLRYNYIILYIYPTIQLQAHLLPLVSNRGAQLMSRIMYQKKFLEYCILATNLLCYYSFVVFRLKKQSEFT